MDAATLKPATDARDRSVAGTLAMRIWLLAVAGLVFAMILVGGATRLTDSGLSITEWQPLVGAVPPLSDAQWEEAFEKYRQIPEYTLINRGMSLAEFKAIYWWEWGHRLLGRLIGVVFFVPFVWFWLRRRISPALMPRLLGVFILGGLQGALGWYMVMSGLVDRVDVSQYRLAAHLGVALAIFGYLVWLALDLDALGAGHTAPASRPAAGMAVVLVGLIFLQMILGALVAGLDAGQGYNTWPLMDGHWVPPGLFVAEPWWLNLFENAMTVQFDHRLVAYAVAVLALVQVLRVFAAAEGIGRASGVALLAVVIAQVGLGVWTLLAQVPISLGLAHQAGAVIVFAVALWHAHDLRRPAEIVGRASRTPMGA